MADAPHILIVEARYYEDVGEHLLSGAIQALENAGATY
jgi:6,7-dimethyl-8-ribityllumazine synthase